MSGLELAFVAAALLTGVAALLAVTSRQLLHSALWLVVALGGLAGVYLVLGAEVVAMVQLLVYVGAVVVLVIFALMLTRAPIGVRAELTAGPGRQVLAALVGVGLTGVIGGTLLAAVGDLTVTPDPSRGTARPLGQAIFTGWVLPFELLSVLLLAALVAALAVSSGASGTSGTTGTGAAGTGAAGTGAAGTGAAGTGAAGSDAAGSDAAGSGEAGA